MNRRSFLRFLGRSPVVVPAAMVAASRPSLWHPSRWPRAWDFSGAMTARDACLAWQAAYHAAEPLWPEWASRFGRTHSTGNGGS